MMQKLIEKFRPWAEALAALDDPKGEYLLMLEDRVSRLEGEVERLRHSGQDVVSPSAVPTNYEETKPRGTAPTA